MNSAQNKLLARDLYVHFNALDDPPADEIHIPVEKIIPDRDDKEFITALIRYVVNYNGRLVHSVRVRFKVDEKLKLLPDTLQYI